MRIEYIKAINFFNHSNTELDFSVVDSPVLICGSNGSGKSSIVIESLSFALFGETRLASIDDAIRNDATQMSVTIGFELNGQTIIVTRSKKRAKTQKLELTIDGSPINEMLTELQKRINALLNLSSNAFRSSIFLRQDDSNFFAKAKPDERKQIISEILDLNQYERLEKIAREKRTTLKSDIKAKLASIENMEFMDIPKLEHELEEVESFLKTNATKLASFEEKFNLLREYNAAILQKQKNRDTIAENNSTIQKRISNNKNKIENAEESVREINLLLKKSTILEVEPIHLEINKYQESLDDVIEKGSALRDAHTELVKNKTKEKTELLQKLIGEAQLALHAVKTPQANIDKLSKLKEADCPTCLREMTSSEISKMKASLQKEVDAAKKIHDNTKKALTEIQNDVEELSEGNFSEALAIKEKITKYQKKYTDTKALLKDTQDRLQVALKNQKSIIENTEKIKSLTKEIIDINEDTKFLQTQFQEVPKISEELKDEQQIKAKYSQAKEQNDEGVALRAQLKQNIEIAERDVKKRQKILSDINQAQSELDLVELLVVAFGKNGIPASIIETILPEIQETANIYLGKMSDDSLEFAFNTTSTLKNGEEKNTLDLSVYDGQVWRSFDSLSGGEGFRVSLAIRLALSKILSRRSGIELETLILDEPGVSLDNQGREMFVSIIKSLGKTFPRIILTTHIPQLAEEFDSRIQLDKTPSGTKILT